MALVVNLEGIESTLGVMTGDTIYRNYITDFQHVEVEIDDGSAGIDGI